MQSMTTTERLTRWTSRSSWTRPLPKRSIQGVSLTTAENDYDRAIKDFDRAIRLNSGDARYYNNRGFALNGKHEYERAIEDFDKAIKLDSGKAMYYNNRGVAHLRLKDYDRALEDFDKTLKIDSKFSSAYHNRGMALSGKGRHDKAVEEFSKVIEMMPSSPVLYKDRGTAYRKLGEYELAVKDFEKAIELDKKFAPAYAALGLLHALAPEPPLRNPAQAERLVEKAVALTKGNSADMLQIMAEVQYALDQRAAAMGTSWQGSCHGPGKQRVQGSAGKVARLSAEPLAIPASGGQNNSLH